VVRRKGDDLLAKEAEGALDGLGAEFGAEHLGAVFFEDIAEGLTKAAHRLVRAKAGDDPSLKAVIDPKLVNAVDVVGVRVGVEDGIDAGDLAFEGLLAEVCGRIDQDAPALPPQPDGGSKAAVSGMS
jgi:hypothetical protein